MRTVPVLCAAAALMLSAAGSAEAGEVVEREGLALEAIASGNWSVAEAELRAGLVKTPNDPMKLLNLAYVLQKSGRAQEAAAVYGQVLVVDSNPLVAVGSSANPRPARAKQLAMKGIASLEK
ncbi:MAG: hypothetical protein AB7E79_16175 [Rhodospirillaceae bacterium]